MTAITLTARIYAAGEEPPAGTVDFTLTADLGSPFDLGGQRVMPLDGRAETTAGRITVVDNSGALTAKIADSGGRAVLLRRVIEILDTTGGSRYAVARITDVRLADDVASYIIEFQDERYIERGTRIFTEQGTVPGSGSASQYAGTLVFPPGIDGNYRHFQVPTISFHGWEKKKQGNYVFAPLDVPDISFTEPNHTMFLKPSVVEWLRSDLKTSLVTSDTGTSGNFNITRARVNGTEREVLTFSTRAGSIPAVTEDEMFRALEDVSSGIKTILYVWVYWPTYASEDITECVLVANTAEPTSDMPALVGGDDGIHPVQAWKDQADEIGLRYDSTAAQALIDDPGYGVIHLRQKRAETFAAWAERVVYRPYMIAPALDDLGRVSLKALQLPKNITLASLFEFTDSNTVPPYPSWNNTSSEQVTRLVYTYPQERRFVSRTGMDIQTAARSFDEYSMDMLAENDREITRDHDRISEFGVHEKKVSLDGLHRESWTVAYLGTRVPGAATIRADWHSRETFERYGDGAIVGKIYGTSATDSVSPGDFVKITLSGFPNPATQARSGTRVVQILAKRKVFAGGRVLNEFHWLDAGPNSQPLTAPTLTAGTVTKFSVDVTVSALPTGAGYVMEAAKADTEPSSTSGLWEVVATGTTNETVTVRPLSSGSKHFFRAYATAPGRFRSAYSGAVNATTTALTAPSGTSIANITGTTADASWTVGEANYPVEVLLDALACASASPMRIALLEPGATAYELEDLDLSTTHCFGVRHVDPYGGVSATATAEFTTTATKPVCPEPADIVVLA